MNIRSRIAAAERALVIASPAAVEVFDLTVREKHAAIQAILARVRKEAGLPPEPVGETGESVAVGTDDMDEADISPWSAGDRR
jgi:hypothetical protein